MIHARLPKGWQARVPKQGTHSEHPGTAVMWDGECFEVISAEGGVSGEGVRYVLQPWQDQYVMRLVDHYDEASEARRLAEYREALRQQKQSAAASFSALVLGHLPSQVQNRLGRELGLSPSKMTILSCVPPVALFGVFVYAAVGASIEQRPSPVPLWLLVFGAYLLVESVVRFHLAMSQSRGIGSAPGFLIYLIYWLTILRRSPEWSPLIAEKGLRLFTLPPSEEIANRDSIEWRGAFLSLLPREDQELLQRRYGFDYRRHSCGVARLLFVFSCAGAATSMYELIAESSFSAFVSFCVAALLAGEQLLRLRRFAYGPAGSVAGLIVRPFVRRFLVPESG